MRYKAINIDPDTMGGTPVFMGTRVPVQTLFDYPEGGDTLEEFIDDYPSVVREQAIEVKVKSIIQAGDYQKVNEITSEK